MSTLTTDIVSGITVLEECPVVITVTYLGDESHKVTETTDIVYSTPENTHFDKTPRILRDVENNTCTAKFVVTANSGASDFTITFSMDKVTDPDAKLEIVFHPIDKDGFSHAAFEPIIIGDSLIKDLSPAADNEEPSEFNGSLLVNIYALSKTNEPLPYFQIPLVINNLVRIFGYDGEQITEEILPLALNYNNNKYYINTNNEGFVALKVFPSKKESGNYTVDMFTELPDFSKKSLSNILFVIEDIAPTLAAPDIVELNGNKLTPSEGNSSTGFHVNIPFYRGVRPKDTVFLMIREGNDETPSASAVVNDLNQLDNFFIPVPYANIPNIGDNELYYYIADAVGNITMSSALYFDLTRSVPNEPPEIRRILARPRIFNHKRQEEFGWPGKIDLEYILGGGLDAHIAVGKNNGIEVNSVINIRIYVNGIVNENPSSKIYSVEPHTVTADEKAAGEAIILLGQAPFTNVDSYSDGTPGSVYITYSVGKKESKIWFGHIDTVPPRR
ncbi:MULTISPECIES: hypothetical protein [Photorhabdus]|uniref:hypothetical protein n=1 Tax=Photorhabdus TaxID=29487 RepID=UPI000DCB7981|nr:MULTISPECIES: hypothetical protein [Photorhabdus]MCT8345299.1 hypothetical protein [Photorhabdus kleinii]RAW93759.1 hypothetical protein CKY03_21795 [Photorhabdus sp. S9-53]RAW93774.1 hypothetical protein CKY05_21855 [Photorhabdus sp. S10-54]RAX05360.1 hypothetical protein CKY04_05700 [Photorhabdus sp. S8-52]